MMVARKRINYLNSSTSKKLFGVKDDTIEWLVVL